MHRLVRQGEALTATSVHRRDEPFKLKNGNLSQLFVDLRIGHSNPRLMLETGRLIISAVPEHYAAAVGTGVDGGAVVSGVVFAAVEQERNIRGYRVSDAENGPIAEQDPKNGRGFRQAWVKDSRVLIVEGTLTTGGSLETAVTLARDAGALVTAAAVVVDRSGGQLDEVAKRLGTHPDTGKQLKIHALFQLDEENGLLVPAQRVE